MCGSTVKLIEWNCIHHGRNCCVLHFLSTKTEIFTFVVVVLSEMNEKFYIHSNIFAFFVILQFFSHAVLFNPFQVIWI